MALIEVLIVIATVLFFLYKIGTSSHGHWKKRGIKHVQSPLPFIGSSWDIIKQRKSPAVLMCEYYNMFKGNKYGGIFVFRQPVLLVRDPDLIKQLMVKDFDHFMNRNVVVDAEADPLFGRNLLSIKDQRWRDMRNTLSPAFTTSKMKAMFHLVEECGEQMTKHIEQKIQEQIASQHPDGDVYETELRSLYTMFTNDVIASTAFGMQVDTLKDPDNAFYNMGKKVTNFQGLIMLKFMGYIVCPQLMKFFKVQLFGAEASTFFRNLIGSTIRMREEQHIVRPDMIHLLMQARKGTLAEDAEKAELTDDDITAQALLFFFAGFETASTALGFASYELAVNKDVQTRLQEEIDSVFADNNDKLTYDALMNDMPYLDMVVHESLRLWPPGFVIDRTASKTYVIPKSETDPEVTLERGDVVWFTVFGMHRDPEFFPEPEKFDPERFSEERKHSIKPFTYLPFGAGPRNCIGMRFALMETKACLVHLLRKFTVEVTSKTDVPLKLSSKNQAQLRPENGFMLGLKLRS